MATSIPFHSTPMGQKYYDETLPGLMAAMNNLAEAIKSIKTETNEQSEKKRKFIKRELLSLRSELSSTFLTKEKPDIAFGRLIDTLLEIEEERYLGPFVRLNDTH